MMRSLTAQCVLSRSRTDRPSYPGGMPAALIWLVAALGLAGAEALTGDMFLLMLGGAPLPRPARVGWLLNWPVWFDGLVFLVVSLLLLVLVRPALRRRLLSGPPQETGIAALEGKQAMVLDQVSLHHGQVKLVARSGRPVPLNDQDMSTNRGPRHRHAHRRRHRGGLAKQVGEGFMDGAGRRPGAAGGSGDPGDHHRLEVGRADPAGRGRGDRTAGPVQPHRERPAHPCWSRSSTGSGPGWTCASGWCRFRRSR